MKNRYPEPIMRFIRQDLGLNETDTSRDDYINDMPENIAFRKVCEWHGFKDGESDRIRGWIELIWGLDLSNR